MKSAIEAKQKELKYINDILTKPCCSSFRFASYFLLSMAGISSTGSIILFINKDPATLVYSIISFSSLGLAIACRIADVIAQRYNQNILPKEISKLQDLETGLSERSPLLQKQNK